MDLFFAFLSHKPDGEKNLNRGFVLISLEPFLTALLYLASSDNKPTMVGRAS